MLLPTEENRKVHFDAFLEKDPTRDGFSLGKSILGRELYCYRLGVGKCNILYVGAHHATEYITASLLISFIDFLSDKFTRIGSFCGIDATYLKEKFTFWIIPCVNPDGVELNLCGTGENPLSARQIRMNGGSPDFSEWNSNSRGVDLNHNYDASFYEYKMRYENEMGITAGRGLYSGEYPESEPEVRLIANFIRTMMPSLIISLHSQGEEIYFSPRTDKVRRMSERMARLTGYKPSEPSGSAEYGGMADYSGGVLKIPSFTVEVGKGKNPLPHEKFPEIDENIRKLLYLAPTLL